MKTGGVNPFPTQWWNWWRLTMEPEIKGWIPPLPWHQLYEEEGWHPGHHRVQEANITSRYLYFQSHQVVHCMSKGDYSLIPPHQSQGHHSPEGWSSKVRRQPCWNTLVEWLPPSLFHSFISTKKKHHPHHPTRCQVKRSFLCWWSHTHIAGGSKRVRSACRGYTTSDSLQI